MSKRNYRGRISAVPVVLSSDKKNSNIPASSQENILNIEKTHTIRGSDGDRPYVWWTTLVKPATSSVKGDAIVPVKESKRKDVPVGYVGDYVYEYTGMVRQPPEGPDGATRMLHISMDGQDYQFKYEAKYNQTVVPGYIASENPRLKSLGSGSSAEDRTFRRIDEFVTRVVESLMSFEKHVAEKITAAVQDREMASPTLEEFRDALKTLQERFPKSPHVRDVDYILNAISDQYALDRLCATDIEVLGKKVPDNIARLLPTDVPLRGSTVSPQTYYRGTPDWGPLLFLIVMALIGISTVGVMAGGSGFFAWVWSGICEKAFNILIVIVSAVITGGFVANAPTS